MSTNTRLPRGSPSGYRVPPPVVAGRERTSATGTYVDLEVENTLDYCISRVVGTYSCIQLQ